MPDRVRDRDDVEHILDGYDASVRKVDAAVGTLLSTLERMGVRDRTAVIITGDHGEALGEHGIYAEHAMAHPPCQRVPMVVSWPGVTDPVAGTASDAQLYQFDLMATICDLAEISAPAAWDAKPFTAALAGRSFEGREQLICGHGIYTFGRAVYKNDKIYIRLLHPGVFSLPGVYNDESMPNHGLELLYDLREDPRMTNNRIAQSPTVAAELRSVLDGWLARTVASPDAEGRDPLARMAATDGPFLYVDPEGLGGVYRRMDATDRQETVVERAGRRPDPGR